MSTFRLSEFKTGDLVSVLCEGGDTRFGEVVDKQQGELVVSVLHKTREQGGRIYRFDKDDIIAPVQSISQHVIPDRPLTRRTVKNAWRDLGFCVGVTDFCLAKDEEKVTLDIGECDTSSSDDDDDDSDSEWEASDGSDWEEADSSDDEFVVETHEAVRAWNDWEPKRDNAKSFKRVVEKIEERAQQEVDDEAFRRGEAAPDVRRPGRKRSKRQRRS